MLSSHIQWAIDNGVKLELVNNEGRYAIIVSKGDIKSAFSLDVGVGFELAQHLLYPAIDSIQDALRIEEQNKETT